MLNVSMTPKTLSYALSLQYSCLIYLVWIRNINYFTHYFTLFHVFLPLKSGNHIPPAWPNKYLLY